MAAKNVIMIIVLVLNMQVFSGSLAVVFSGSNNGYFRDCG